MLFFDTTPRQVDLGLTQNATAFGPNLARLRMNRGVSLESIATATGMPRPLWEAFEDNELQGWPIGALARSLVADYARLIGEDPPATVNEFCRLFPNGDRRSRCRSDRATSVGQPLVWTDDGPVGERRAERRAAATTAEARRRLWRRADTAIVLADLGVIAVIASAVAVFGGSTLPDTLMGTATLYYTACAVFRWSIGGWAIARLRNATLDTTRYVAAPEPR
jgi:hypothetical protein